MEEPSGRVHSGVTRPRPTTSKRGLFYLWNAGRSWSVLAYRTRSAPKVPTVRADVISRGFVCPVCARLDAATPAHDDVHSGRMDFKWEAVRSSGVAGGCRPADLDLPGAPPPSQTRRTVSHHR